MILVNIIIVIVVIAILIILCIVLFSVINDRNNLMINEMERVISMSNLCLTKDIR